MSGRARTGRVRTLLEIQPEHWWLGWLDGQLVVDATRIESYLDSSGVAWVVVEGWRQLAHGGRRWSRDLVHPAALPPELLPDEVTPARALTHDQHQHR